MWTVGALRRQSERRPLKLIGTSMNRNSSLGVSARSTTDLPQSDNSFLDTSLDVPFVNRGGELYADGELAQASS